VCDRRTLARSDHHADRRRVDPHDQRPAALANHLVARGTRLQSHRDATHYAPARFNAPSMNGCFASV
jgi:hypothetical protein